MRSSPIPFRRLLALARPESRTLLLGTFFLIVGSAAGLAWPQLVRVLIDDALSGGDSSRLDRAALMALARRCHRVLVVHEDTRTGSIGESVAAAIQEEAFEWLDAPVRVVGALDTPIPYSPPLEEFFLPSEAQVERAARLLAGY